MKCFFLLGADWWTKAGRGKRRVTAYIGVSPEVAEIIYQKYLARRQPKFSRLSLWILLAWLRSIPIIAGTSYFFLAVISWVVTVLQNYCKPS